MSEGSERAEAEPLRYLGRTYLAVPGKHSWECPVIRRRPELAARVQLGLAHVPGVARGRANYWTGRVQVEYEPARVHETASDVQAVLARYVDQVVVVCVDGQGDLTIPAPDDAEAQAASAVALGRELVRILLDEARTALAETSRLPPERQPSVLRLLQRIGPLLRGGAPGASTASPQAGAPEQAERGGVAEPTAAPSPRMPTLEPLVAGLSQWVVQRFGEERVAELIDAADGRSVSGLLERLVSGRDATPSASPASASGASRSAAGGTAPRRGVLGAIIGRLEQLDAMLQAPEPSPPDRARADDGDGLPDPEP